MARERLEISDELCTLPDGRSLPWVRIVRDDGKPRQHHPRCPSYPGEPLDERTVCCDCVYGDLMEEQGG